jgi:hypothetical protein
MVNIPSVTLPFKDKCGIDLIARLSDNGQTEATMNIQVELSPEAGSRLKAEANAQGVALETYAGTLLQRALSGEQSHSGKLTEDELQAMLRQIADGSEKLPALPTSALTRESFYEDRP